MCRMFDFSLIWEVNYNEWYRYIRKRIKNWSINSFVLWLCSSPAIVEIKKGTSSYKVREFPESFCNAWYICLGAIIFPSIYVGLVSQYVDICKKTLTLT